MQLNVWIIQVNRIKIRKVYIYSRWNLGNLWVEDGTVGLNSTFYRTYCFYLARKCEHLCKDVFDSNCCGLVPTKTRFFPKLLNTLMCCGEQRIWDCQISACSK